MNKEQPKLYMPSKYEEKQAENIMTEKQKQLTKFRENKKEKWDEFGIEELECLEVGAHPFYSPPIGTRSFWLKGKIKGHEISSCYYDYRGCKGGYVRIDPNSSRLSSGGEIAAERYTLSIDDKEVEDRDVAKKFFKKYEELATGVELERNKEKAMKEIEDYHNKMEKEEEGSRKLKDVEDTAKKKSEQEAIIKELLD